MKKRIFFAALTACAIIATLTAETRSSKQDISKNLQIFSSIYKALQTNYVDTIDATTTMKNGINAMLYMIDPYNEYFPADDQDELRSISTGQFGGIGSYIMQDRLGRTVISKPQPGTPSYNAGMRPGDIIWTIDGDTVTSLGSAKVRERLRGSEGTHLSINVHRPYPDTEADSSITFEITRAAIPVNPVPYYGVLRDSLGYIELTEFTEQAPDLVRNALIELKKDPRVKGIVLDLQGNGGGLLESAVKIVGLFTPRGTEVVRTRGRNQQSERIYRTTNNPIDTEIPLAVLIDENSASSSEITAGALQDLDRAVIIGERSYGKGLVQSTFGVPGDGLLKVTTARYYIPSGRLIQAIDYSHRDENGNVTRMPDSLTTVYYTRAGRPVRDGGGITPDVKISYDPISRLTYNIVHDNYHFDFANRFVHLNPAFTPDPYTYVLPDSVYESFKEFIIESGFDYDRPYKNYIDNLRSVLKTEGYDTDEVSQALDNLNTLLQHDLATELDIQRPAIQKYLTNEILERYHPNGARINSLRNDSIYSEALKVLYDPDRISSILSAPDNSGNAQ